ncbi:PAS domain-containing hybrid sensor histidine kinase/response regulator [Candidatus Magnetaquicoccus inordinatus]|uniref:PAS domain-containing hybrid sensor histidine kinase/response regulator n=1 Tax=Candidatus Magnetaquicoccus inordinatus TaxID=2496818 RepID=UPI00102AEC03|nr:ATP-binding protein [Candidatus Magnetaquicoccus inordinatus]
MIHTLHTWSPARILLATLFFSELGTLAVVTLFSWYFHHTIRFDFLLTGFVTDLIMSFAVVSLYLLLLRRLQKQTTDLQQSHLSLQLTQGKLHQLNDLLAQAVARMPIAFIVWDTQFCATDWNPAAERIFGYSKAEALGRTPLQLFVPQAALQPVAGAMADLLAGIEAGYSQPGNNITKDGRIISCLWFNVPLKDSSNQVHGVLSMALDVTESEELEQALRLAKDRAEAANQAKTRFLTTISHEIRTPMNVVLGMSELLLETALDQEQERLAQIIYRSGKSLLEVINDVLDFARIESGRMPLDAEPFSPRLLVEESADLMRVVAHGKGLLLRVQIDPALPEAIVGDEGKVRQILINLLGNAVKFTQKGEIFLQVQADPEQEESLLFAVRDTGIGIAAEQIAMIFEDFTQADSGISRRYGGTGLGLAICRKLIECMGGRIWVNSSVGEGSCFYFTLPARATTLPAAAANEDAGSSSPLPGQKLRILLAEDSSENQLLVQLFLKNSPHELVIVSDGAEAVSAIAQQQFDLLITDIQMPLMDGYTAVRLLRQREQELSLPPLPIVALSAHASQDKREESFAAGCNEHMCKPIKKRELLQLLDRYSVLVNTEK